jgi:hypothetical protein
VSEHTDKDAADLRLMNDLAGQGQGLIGPYVEQLIAMGSLQDLDDWFWPYPARYEIQVRQLAIPCGDVLQWGLRALQIRYSGIGAVSARFLAETLALVRWLSIPTSPDARQERSFMVLKRELSRARGLFDKATRKATPGFKEALTDRTRDMEEALRALDALVARLGVRDLKLPPDRPRMLDDVLEREGGYGFFAVASEFAGHPGFMHLNPFAVADTGRMDVNLGEMAPYRLFWAVTQVELFARLVKATGDALSWDGWFEDYGRRSWIPSSRSESKPAAALEPSPGISRCPRSHEAPSGGRTGGKEKGPHSGTPLTSAPDGLRSRDLRLDRAVRTTRLLYGRRVFRFSFPVPPTGFEPVLPP